MDRQLQWVAPGGVVCRVAATIARIVAAGIWGLRPRPGWISVRPVGPRSAKRCRHSRTVGRLSPKSRAIWLVAIPSAAASTRRARAATACGVLGARTQASNTRRCCADTARAGAARPMPPA